MTPGTTFYCWNFAFSEKVFTGFDCNVTMALTRTEEIFVWGAVTGPIGQPHGQKHVSIYIKPEDKYTFQDADSDEESDIEDPEDLLLPVKLERLSEPGLKKELL